MSLSEAFKAIMEEDVRHKLKSAELWDHYAEVGEFKSEDGRKVVFAMGKHFRDSAAKTKVRLQGIPTTANPLGKPDTEFVEAEAERKILIEKFKAKDKDA